VPLHGDHCQQLGSENSSDGPASVRDNFMQSVHTCNSGHSGRAHNRLASVCDQPASMHQQQLWCMHREDRGNLGSSEGSTSACDQPLQALPHYRSSPRAVLFQPRSSSQPVPIQFRPSSGPVPIHDSGFADLQSGLVEEDQTLAAKAKFLPFMKSCRFVDRQSRADWGERAMKARVSAQSGDIRTNSTGGVGISLKGQLLHLEPKSVSASKTETTVSTASSLASVWACGSADSMQVNPASFSSIHGKSRGVEVKSPLAPDMICGGTMRVSSHMDLQRAILERNISLRQCDHLANNGDQEDDDFSDGGPVVLDCS